MPVCARFERVMLSVASLCAGLCNENIPGENKQRKIKHDG